MEGLGRDSIVCFSGAFRVGADGSIVGDDIHALEAAQREPTGHKSAVETAITVAGIM